jgi:hypothetical protein
MANLASTFAHLSEAELQKIATSKDRAKWACYSGPYKLTPMYNTDPINAFPFEGRGIMSQKLDGMFMLWDGVSQMYNRGRGGASAEIHEQHPPEDFYQHLPAGIELEGELAYRNGEYSRGHGACTNGWRDACFWVFDAPLHPGTYAERWASLQELLAGYDPRYVRPVPFLGIATSRRVVDATLARVRATVVPRQFASGHNIGAHYEGGEGVMIRDPDARYVHSCHAPKTPGHKKGQTTSLYKWLEEYGNDECIVLGLAPPVAAEAAPAEPSSPTTAKRRRKSNGAAAPVAAAELGANSLRVALPNGTEFELSSISRLGMMARDIAAGSIITFTYHGWSGGRPLRASAQALRTDRSWVDIRANFIPPPALETGLAAGRVKRMASM